MGKITGHFLFGPVATAAFAAGLLLASHSGLTVPAPVALTAVMVLISTYIGGVTSGLLSFAIAFGFAFALLAEPDASLLFTPANASRIETYVIILLPAVAIIAWLRRRVTARLALERHAREAAEAANRELEVLRAALNQIHVGVLLLDEDLRLQFINNAMREVGNVPDDQVANRPSVRQLLEFACRTNVFPVQPDIQESYIDARVREIEEGDPNSRELALGSGDVARTQCVVLPHGGRLLVYTIVTDLVRQARELANLRDALNQIDYGIVLLDRDLRAEFSNKAVQSLGGLPEAALAGKPHIGDVLREVAARDAYAVSQEERERFVRERIDWMKQANPPPFEMKVSDGRVVRVKCIALADGARMVTYSDETETAHQVDELEELASVDSLTGLYNRRHFERLLDAEWQRFRRSGRPLSVLMLDIDHFKSVNDRFGHDAGDQVLKRLAERCLTAGRGSDIICRYGGEELAVLLPQTDRESAVLAAERLRVAISERPFTIGSRTLSITASIGAATANAGTASIQDLIKRADEALYTAKRSGRDRVVGSPAGTHGSAQPASAA